MSESAWEDDGKPGSAHIVAFALSIWPQSAARRSALRAFLPVGATRGGTPSANAKRPGSSRRINRVTVSFQDALRNMEKNGLICRDGELVHILDRAGLSSLGLRVKEDRKQLCSVAVENIKRQERETEDRSPLAQEQRRQDLLMIQRLMEDVGRHSDSGRRAVRLVPRSRTL